jgi:hypothetical protein
LTPALTPTSIKSRVVLEERRPIGTSTSEEHVVNERRADRLPSLGDILRVAMLGIS